MQALGGGADAAFFGNGLEQLQLGEVHAFSREERVIRNLS
jgi:hypothetical protein